MQVCRMAQASVSNEAMSTPVLVATQPGIPHLCLHELHSDVYLCLSWLACLAAPDLASFPLWNGGPKSPAGPRQH